MKLAHAQNQQQTKAAPYNVILLTADQMSADYMHLYGALYQDTPNIEKLAARDTVFKQMYAGAPWTNAVIRCASDQTLPDGKRW